MVGQMKLRSTTANDNELVGDLLVASYPVLMRVGYPYEVLQAALPAITEVNPTLLTSGTFYMLQRDDGLAVGCGGWTFERPGTSEIITGLAHIRHFATHPDWTGKGIGRKIFECCEENARLAGAQQFECYSSLNADAFYSALGFTTIEHFDVPMGPGLIFPSIRMTRSI